MLLVFIQLFFLFFYFLFHYKYDLTHMWLHLTLPLSLSLTFSLTHSLSLYFSLSYSLTLCLSFSHSLLFIFHSIASSSLVIVSNILFVFVSCAFTRQTIKRRKEAKLPWGEGKKRVKRRRKKFLGKSVKGRKKKNSLRTLTTLLCK